MKKNLISILALFSLFFLSASWVSAEPSDSLANVPKLSNIIIRGVGGEALVTADCVGVSCIWKDNKWNLIEITNRDSTITYKNLSNGSEVICDEKWWCTWNDTAWSQNLNWSFIESTTPPSNKWPIKIYTSERIPGGNCKCWSMSAGWTFQESACASVEKRLYECTIEPGLWSFQSLLATIIRYFINIVLLLGVLAIVGAGILMSFWSDSEEYTKKAKWWAINIIIGLIILFAFRYILWLLAPWIYQ